ncbi:MAG: hypothetical protein V1760_01485 [Candidatus Peregrinibacteria bacterium]
MRFKRLKTQAVLLFILLIWVTSLAYAAPLGNRDVDLSTPVGSDILPGGGFFAESIREGFLFKKLLPFLIQYGLGLAVSLAVVALIIGGYQFMTSYGNQESRQAAQKTVTYAIIGLIIAIAAFGIVAVISNFSFV